MARGDELGAISRPFVFRKYLDFGAINAMRDLHAQIRREVARRDMANNIKLGPGGIREIEFIAQVFQLVRGGRDLALQVKATLKVLALLPERGILDGDTPSPGSRSPTTSCASWSTGCSISTTPRPITCRMTPRTRP